MKVKLKQFRVRAGMTQTKIAEMVGVTQPNYQRWETGAAPIPPAKLKKLAQVLETSPGAIYGRHKPIEAGIYDDSVSDELSYYGEVAIHFLGGGKPLLLSISEDAFTRLHRDLQGDAAFVTVESLANQTVALRTQSIADLFFSSEAYDDYGPEVSKYVDHIELQMPDPRDWEIVECIAAGDTDDFDPAEVERVSGMIMFTDKQYEKLVAEGCIKYEDLETERNKNQIKTDRILNAAHMAIYQLSTGQIRSIDVYDAEKLYDAFYGLIDFGDDVSDLNMIRVEAEGRHRTIFINKGALDYVAIPTHKFEEGRIEAEAADS